MFERDFENGKSKVEAGKISRERVGAPDKAVTVGARLVTGKIGGTASVERP